MMSIIIMLAAFAIPMGMIIGFVFAFRWWRRRDDRMSPLHKRHLVMGYVPGQQLAEVAADRKVEAGLSLTIMYFSVPCLLLGWALHRVPAERMRIDGSAVFYIVVAMFVFGYGLIRFMTDMRAFRAANQGLLAERVTGMQLNRLMAQNCMVLHDLPCEGFNIDHVVISPRGVFAIETKSFRKPSRNNTENHYVVNYDGKLLRFPDFVQSEAVTQAERQAQWLSRRLRETLQGTIEVIPALALPGWKVQQAEEVWRSAKVKVFSPLGRGAEFMAKPIPRLSDAQRALIAQTLTQLYPSIDH